MDTIKRQAKGVANLSGATATGRRPLTPTTHTFEGFTHNGKRIQTRSSIPKRMPSKRNDFWSGTLKIALIGGVTLAVLAVLALGVSGPKDPWVFDRPEAQRPSLQTKHTLY